MFEETIERMVLNHRNFRAFSGLFTTAIQFRARVGLVFLGSSRVRTLPSQPTYNSEQTNSVSCQGLKQ